MIPGQNVSIIAVQPHGGDAIELTYKTAEGEVDQRVLGRDAERNLAIAKLEARPFDAIAADFKLVAECQRIKLGGRRPCVSSARKRTSATRAPRMP